MFWRGHIQNCRAKDKNCFECGRLEHFRKVCRRTNENYVEDNDEPVMEEQQNNKKITLNQRHSQTSHEPIDGKRLTTTTQYWQSPKLLKTQPKISFAIMGFT